MGQFQSYKAFQEPKIHVPLSLVNQRIRAHMHTHTFLSHQIPLTKHKFKDNKTVMQSIKCQGRSLMSMDLAGQHWSQAKEEGSVLKSRINTRPEWIWAAPELDCSKHLRCCESHSLVWLWSSLQPRWIVLTCGENTTLTVCCPYSNTALIQGHDQSQGTCKPKCKCSMQVCAC